MVYVCLGWPKDLHTLPVGVSKVTGPTTWVPYGWNRSQIKTPPRYLWQAWPPAPELNAKPVSGPSSKEWRGKKGGHVLRKHSIGNMNTVQKLPMELERLILRTRKHLCRALSREQSQMLAGNKPTTTPAHAASSPSLVSKSGARAMSWPWKREILMAQRDSSKTKRTPVGSALEARAHKRCRRGPWARRRDSWTYFVRKAGLQTRQPEWWKWRVPSNKGNATKAR